MVGGQLRGGFVVAIVGIAVASTWLGIAAAQDAPPPDPQSVLVAEVPEGFSLAPEGPGSTGPITSDRLIGLGVELSTDVREALEDGRMTGYARVWIRPDPPAVLVASVLAASDDDLAAEVLRLSLDSLDEAGGEAIDVPDIENAVGRSIEQAGAQLHVVAFRRGVFTYFLAANESAALAVDVANRQAAVAPAGDSEPAGDDEGVPVMLLVAAALAIAGVVAALLRQRRAVAAAVPAAPAVPPAPPPMARAGPPRRREPLRPSGR